MIVRHHIVDFHGKDGYNKNIQYLRCAIDYAQDGGPNGTRN